MWLRILYAEVEHLSKPSERSSSKLFRAIVTDIHFWIPFTILLGGLALLDKLR